MEEKNELGEIYQWKFVPANLTSWNEADKAWDSSGANQPWDTYGNEGRWEVSTKRTLQFSSDRHSYMHRYSKDYLSFLDFKPNNNNVLYNDLEIKDGALPLSKLKEIAHNGTPIEYEDARPLLAGEYTYQKAIVGIKMRTYNLSTKMGFYKSKLNIDVEDIVDRGKVDVVSTDKSKPTTVLFHKIYYNPPEELLFNILEFVEPCTVEVLTKTEKEFTFMLKSTINKDKYVTGKVSWLATGY